MHLIEENKYQMKQSRLHYFTKLPILNFLVITNLLDICLFLSLPSSPITLLLVTTF